MSKVSGSAMSPVPACPVLPAVPLEGWAGEGGSGEPGQLLCPCGMWGWDPRGLGQRLSSDAILRRGGSGPPLPRCQGMSPCPLFPPLLTRLR